MPTDPLMKRIPLIAAILVLVISACLGGWQLTRHLRERYGFPQAECEIVDTKTAPEQNSDGDYIYRLTYRVKYYTAGSGSSATDATSQEFYPGQKQLDGALGRFQGPPNRYPCWFNPQEPSTASLKRPSVAVIVLDFLTIFVGGPLVALLLFFMMRLSITEAQ